MTDQRCTTCFVGRGDFFSIICLCIKGRCGHELNAIKNKSAESKHMARGFASDDLGMNTVASISEQPTLRYIHDTKAVSKSTITISVR